jgi:hypothetical protein
MTLKHLEVTLGTTIHGDLDMNGMKITNIATPTTDTDATTKLYVDDEVSALRFLSSKGDILSHDGTDQAVLTNGDAGDVLTCVPANPTGLGWAALPAPPALTSAKGDLITHNGTIQIIFPVTNSRFLASDNGTATGLDWKDLATSATTVANFTGSTADPQSTVIRWTEFPEGVQGDPPAWLKMGTFTFTGTGTILTSDAIIPAGFIPINTLYFTIPVINDQTAAIGIFQLCSDAHIRISGGPDITTPFTALVGTSTINITNISWLNDSV